MTREELFRAVGEVREDQIEAAGIVKKQVCPWRRLGALAACLALVVTAAAVPWGNRGQPDWKSIIYSFNPAAAGGGGADAGGGAYSGGLDGTLYWTDDPIRPTHPDYSEDVEIGELSGPGKDAGRMGLSADAPWLTPEELFAQDTVIFRGTVRELKYFEVNMGMFNQGVIGLSVYYTRAIVEVTDSIRGGLTVGENYSLLWLGAKGYMTTSLIGPLEDLDTGSEAIFMPIRTGQETGWRERSSYFCYADLAELYLGEGERYVFADTGDGLEFGRDAYPELAEAETLDEVAAYIRGMVEQEHAQPAETPPKEQSIGQDFVQGGPQGALPEPNLPQTEEEPSKTAEAGIPADGPEGGARELPGGAFIGGEEAGEGP